ncbi:MAG: xanthine dehydrogenase family protein molybdopterin-binding subunit [bacterium]
MSWIAKSVPRIGAQERVRGKPIFSADIALEDALVLRVFRSDRAHARILELDVEEAKRVPGVEGVFTAAHVPGRNLIGLITKDQPLLAKEKVRFVGDPVALVAARDEIAAQKGLEAIKVKYQDLPAVFSPKQAMDQAAPAIHEKGNLLHKRVIRKGDAASSMAKAAVVVERTYETSHVEHTYLEPDAGVGYLEWDNTLVILASTQNPHYDQKEVAEVLGLKEEKVRIIQAATGGGFGSKLDLTVQGFIGLALYHLGKPVRLVFSREEAYLATPKRHPLTIWMKSGADARGKLLALQARIICDTGAYCSYGVAVATRAAIHATGPYEVENVDVESLAVYTNNPVAGAMRGFGVPQIAFAHESQMDLLAQELGMDPLEIRRINALRQGSLTATSQKLGSSVGILQALEALEPHYRESLAAWKNSKEHSPYVRRGVGLGAMWYGIGNTGVQNPSTARVELEENGGLTLFTGAADMGQGSTTVLAQIAAQVLGVPPESLKLVVADTKHTTNAGASSASRQTYISGNAVLDACNKLAQVLLTEASDLLKAPKEALLLRQWHVVHAGDPTRKVSFQDLAKRAKKKNIPLSWQGYFDPETTPLEPEGGQGVPYATYAFACQMAQVEVDVLTGSVQVQKIVAAHDVGKALNPEAVKGQILGGVAMGVGFALMEEYKAGSTESMKDYHIPTVADMPQVLPIIVEAAEPTGPFGAKGVGEPALIPTAPAILNAIADALGERIYKLPANLERVLEACIKAGHFPSQEVNGNVQGVAQEHRDTGKR